jgi:hypothetical protein
MAAFVDHTSRSAYMLPHQDLNFAHKRWTAVHPNKNEIYFPLFPVINRVKTTPDE